MKSRIESDNRHIILIPENQQEKDFLLKVWEADGLTAVKQESSMATRFEIGQYTFKGE